MTRQTRRNYSPSFKAKVAVEAIREESTIAEIAAKHQIHPTMVSLWKKQLLENVEEVFERGRKKEKPEIEVEELYKQIGQLKVENDFLARGLNRIR